MNNIQNNFIWNKNSTSALGVTCLQSFDKLSDIAHLLQTCKSASGELGASVWARLFQRDFKWAVDWIEIPLVKISSNTQLQALFWSRCYRSCLNQLLLWKEKNSVALNKSLDPFVSQVISLPGGEKGVATRGDSDKSALWIKSFSKQLPWILKEHTGEITCIAQFADRRLATGSTDRTVRIWDLRDGSSVVLKNPLSGRVRCLAIVPGEEQIAVGCRDALIHVWNVKTQSRAYTVPLFPGRPGFSEGIQCITSFKDGSVGVGGISHGGCVKLEGLTGTVNLFSEDSHAHFTQITPIAQFNSPDTLFVNMEQAPSSREHLEKIALALRFNRSVLLGSQEGMLQMRDLQDSAATIDVGTHNSPITSICPLPDGRHAVGSKDGKALIWDLKTKTFTPLYQGTTAIVSLSILPQGIAIACADGTVKTLWLDGQKMMEQFELLPEAQPKPTTITTATSTLTTTTTAPVPVNRERVAPSNRLRNVMITVFVVAAVAMFAQRLFTERKGT